MGGLWAVRHPLMPKDLSCAMRCHCRCSGTPTPTPAKSWWLAVPRICMRRSRGSGSRHHGNADAGWTTKVTTHPVTQDGRPALTFVLIPLR